MEETKIWEVEGTSATPLNTTNQMESEGLLEDILTANPDMLEEGLQLVGRQTSTPGGPLDLLGVDTDGRLVVFELKRGTLSRDAVAQVIDYASSLNTMDLDDLRRHIEEQSGKFGIQEIDNFDEWYSDNYRDLDLLTPPRMVLVGLGADDTTVRMVDYMTGGGMDISLLTFYGFVNSDGKNLLARNVEGSEVVRPPVTDSIKEFERYAAGLGVSYLLNAVTDLFGETFRYEHKWASVKLRNLKRMNFAIGNQSYLFLAIDATKPGIINVGFHPVAIDLALDEFNKLGLDQGETLFEKGSPGFAKKTTQVDYAVMLPLKSPEDLNAHKKQLTTLAQAVYEAYQKAQPE